MGKLPWYGTSQPGQLSLAIPPWVGAVSTVDCFGHCKGRNSELCVTAGLVTMTAGILI